MTYRWMALISAVVILFLSAASVPAGDIPLRVQEMAITTRIVKGSPIDSVRRISSASVKALYCFTRVTAADDDEREIVHVWYRNGEVVGEYSLPVKGESWRTYSKKLISKGMQGDWRVEARDIDGTVLKTVEFRMN
jgi:hypothetical protein